MGKCELEGQCSEAVQFVPFLTLGFLYFPWKPSVLGSSPFLWGHLMDLLLRMSTEMLHLSTHKKPTELKLKQSWLK